MAYTEATFLCYRQCITRCERHGNKRSVHDKRYSEIAAKIFLQWYAVKYKAR